MSAAPRILVVEDDPHVRRINYIILRQAGYEVDAVPDGLQGLEALKSRAYNLLVTDHVMPGIKGTELIQRIRMLGITVPVILAAGFMGAKEEGEFRGMAVEGRLEKPYRVEELVGLVRSVLSSAGHLSGWKAA